jgi:hypothetical protein
MNSVRKSGQRLILKKIINLSIIWGFGADARGIAEFSNMSLGIEPQRRKSLKKIDLPGFHDFSAIKTFGWTVQLLEFAVGPAVGVRLW